MKPDYKDYLRIFSQYSVDLNRAGDKDYRVILGNRGYLVGDPPTIEFLLSSPFFHCALVDNKIVGFIRGDKLEKNRDKNTNLFQNSTTNWLNNNTPKDKFERQEGLMLGVIMVDNKYLRSGIGSGLFNKLSNYLIKERVQNLFSWVVNIPQNKPSLCFHRNKGFSHLATFNAKVAFGIPDYQSYLLYKRF